jgi:hypothetical protein
VERGGQCLRAGGRQDRGPRPAGARPLWHRRLQVRAGRCGRGGGVPQRPDDPLAQFGPVLQGQVHAGPGQPEAEQPVGREDRAERRVQVRAGSGTGQRCQPALCRRVENRGRPDRRAGDLQAPGILQQPEHEERAGARPDRDRHLGRHRHVHRDGPSDGCGGKLRPLSAALSHQREGRRSPPETHHRHVAGGHGGGAGPQPPRPERHNLEKGEEKP